MEINTPLTFHHFHLSLYKCISNNQLEMSYTVESLSNESTTLLSEVTVEAVRL